MKPARLTRSPKTALTLVAICLAAWTPARASQTPQADFAETYQARQTTLTRTGTGVLKYLGFISIYRGALYLPPDVDPQQALADVPKRLEVKYLRAFDKEDFGPATLAGIKNNVSTETFARLESRIAYHNSLYEDIAPGDRVALTYIPAEGTRVEINGLPQGTVEGADFAAALFSMWLGDKPFDKGFKQALLGDRR